MHNYFLYTYKARMSINNKLVLYNFNVNIKIMEHLNLKSNINNQSACDCIVN